MGSEASSLSIAQMPDHDHSIIGPDLTGITGGCLSTGFVQLAAVSDEKRLVFYVKWQDHFPDPSGLFRDFDVGYKIPDRFVPQIVPNRT